MKVKRAKAGWGTCFGVLGLLALCGVVTTFAARPSAEAQTPPRTPQQIFNRACGRCHPDGGEDTGPEILNKRITEEKMRHTIRTGTKRMRAIPPTKLSDPDLDAMMAYLRDPLHAMQ